VATSFFIGVMDAPWESEMITTMLRMVHEALGQGHEVAVWTCGGGTSLTIEALAGAKPGNPLDMISDRKDRQYPAIGALIRELLRKGNGRFEWLVCRHCMEERGATGQMQGVRIQPPFRFAQRLNSASVSIVMGVK
jgi:hypothetical protein